MRSSRMFQQKSSNSQFNAICTHLNERRNTEHLNLYAWIAKDHGFVSYDGHTHTYGTVASLCIEYGGTGLFLDSTAGICTKNFLDEHNIKHTFVAGNLGSECVIEGEISVKMLEKLQDQLNKTHIEEASPKTYAFSK